MIKNCPIVFINCDLFPFVFWIAKHKKIFETRNRNTLKSLIGKRVYIAETRKGKRPVVRCAAILESVSIIDSFTEYDKLRNKTMIETGSAYDWKPETKRKYLYKLSSVETVSAFVPVDWIRHGFTWMEYNGIAQ